MGPTSAKNHGQIPSLSLLPGGLGSGGIHVFYSHVGYHESVFLAAEMEE